MASCGEHLPLEARILAAVDAYEAMTSDRSYRDSIGHAAAQAELSPVAPAASSTSAWSAR